MAPAGGTAGHARHAAKGLTALALGAVLLGAAACSGGGSGTSSSANDGKAPAGGSATTPGPQAAVTITPRNGATGVDTTGALKISAAKGKLTKVTAASSGGATVDGAISADGGSWTPVGHTPHRYALHGVRHGRGLRRPRLRTAVLVHHPDAQEP